MQEIVDQLKDLQIEREKYLAENNALHQQIQQAEEQVWKIL